MNTVPKIDTTSAQPANGIDPVECKRGSTWLRATGWSISTA